MEIEFLKEVEQYVVEMRRWFHRYPEISLHEKETSNKIKQELTKMGIDFEELIPTYGIVATIKGGIDSNKKIGARADMDALPVCEQTGLSFSSANEGVMHACGHDAHIAMLLGVAKILMKKKAEIAGTVKLFFQAGEEMAQGVLEIIDHIEKNGGIDEVIGTHIWSGIPSGQILLKPGAIFAGSGRIFYKITGQGGHGARPDLVHDPIKAACDLIMHLSSIPSNFNDVFDNAVVTSCQIEAGTAWNIFPDTAYVRGSFRHFRKETCENLLQTIDRIAQGVAMIHNVTIDNSDTPVNYIPVVFNNPEMIEKAKLLVKDVQGLELSSQIDPICASDNFAKLLEKYKGIYAILGAGKHGEDIYPHHNAKFDIDEAVFIKGTTFTANYILEYCKE